MDSDPIVILGGSVAGMAAALQLARVGQSVLIIERDDLPVGTADDAVGQQRKGVPHFLQPHAFMPRGRKELRDRLPDVYDDLIASGAWDVDLRTKLPGPLTQEDRDLQYLAVRRPLIEWVLRRAVAGERRIEVRGGAEATGLRVEGGRVAGVSVEGQDVPARLVIDAGGRRSKTSEWLEQCGVEEATTETSDCGVVYYSRYYKLRDGCELPDGPWLLGPRGDLGYLGFTTFPGDNGTFAALLAVPTGRPSSRAFKQPAVFEAAIAAIPLIRQWADADRVDPITDVMTMAGLRNSLRPALPSSIVRLVPVGDARCHTDPVLALGLSISLVQAAVLADVMADGVPLDDVGAAVHERTSPMLRERYDHATELDAQRLRMWQGDAVDFRSREGDYALFSVVAGGVAALTDPELFRTFVRRIGGLDSTEVLDGNAELQRRIEAAFQSATTTPRPNLGPSQDEMDAITSSVDTATVAG